MTCCQDSATIVQESVQVSLGGSEFLTQAVLYELMGNNITADSVQTCLVAAGATPSGWAAPDLLTFGSISVHDYLLLYPGDTPMIDPTLPVTSSLYWAAVDDQVDASGGLGNFQWYIKLVNGAQVIIRLIGEIQLL